MLEIEEKYQLEKEILKTLRLLEITRHPEKRKRLDRKLQGLFKKLQVLTDLEKNQKSGIIPLPSDILANTSENKEENA